MRIAVLSPRSLCSLLFLVALAGCGSAGALAVHSHPAGVAAHARPAGTRPHGVFSTATTPAGTSQPRAASGEALVRILKRSIPERNLYVLADQLRLHPPRRIPHVIRTVSPNYPVRHRDSFEVLGEDANRYFVMKATIRAETPHLYMYVQDGLNLDNAGLQRAATTFERSIYPTDRSYFGSEWRPGVDGDPHITCLIGDLRSSGVGGYYSAEDEYPHMVNPYSNQREMFYIDSGGATPGTESFNSTLAHEFQHMIHWHMHAHESLWLNEGMSMLAERLNNYPPVDEPQTFVASPTTQLDTWNQTASASVAHYGAAYLFLAYLYDRFGRGFVRDILSDKSYTDFELINDVLHRRHINTTADALFSQWVVANYVNDRTIAHGIYGYSQLPHSVSVQQITGSPFTYKSSVPPYAAQYVVINHFGSNSVHLTFSAPTTVPVVGATSASHFWWSNRGDMADTRLMRSVDLSSVQHASLHFTTWYDIEKDYDYGYVEASLDGGTTWTTLPGTHTTSANPNGANYGYAYTGTTRAFRNEVVDLSRYAGHHILLRFEYVTDEGYNGQSWVLENLSIPEIHWRDNFTGWTQQGFVPIGTNALPSHWTVQLVSYTGTGVHVGHLKITGGKGSLLVHPTEQGLKKLVVVVFTTAPKTTVSSPYTLSAVEG